MALGVIGMGVAAAAGIRAQEESADAGSAGGGAPGSAMPLTFSANMGGQASYRRRLNLEPTGGSGRSMRVESISHQPCGVSWRINAVPRTSVMSPMASPRAMRCESSTMARSALP